MFKGGLKTITNLLDFTEESSWDGVCELIACKRALSPSGLPGIDYALNPYGGCEHGCVYCYAPEVTHTTWDNWRVVKIRSNIVQRLVSELHGIQGTIGIGTVTDPYQYAESKYMLTQGCLKVLKSRGYRVHIHTKSDLILRDIDLIKSMDNEVGITITTLDNKISKMTEPGATLPEDRLKTLKELVSEGINAYALVGPVLSHLEGKEEEFMDNLIDTGVKHIVIDKLNARPILIERLNRMNISGSENAIVRICELASENNIEITPAFPSKN